MENPSFAITTEEWSVFPLTWSPLEEIMAFFVELLKPFCSGLRSLLL
jgi:hypothetical protein